MATKNQPRRPLARWCDHLATLSCPDLLDVHTRVRNEVERRARLAVGAYDAAQIICGQEAAKRAVTVAAAGKHSLFLYGPPNCGKSMLRAVALKLDLPTVAEDWPCPCGHCNDPRHDCLCTPRQIMRYRTKFPRVDITVEVPPVPPREMGATTVHGRTGLADIQRQIAAATHYTTTELSEDCRHALRMCVDDCGLDASSRQRLIAVARTIANLDWHEFIELPHLYEALNYRRHTP